MQIGYYAVTIRNIFKRREDRGTETLASITQSIDRGSFMTVAVDDVENHMMKVINHKSLREAFLLDRVQRCRSPKLK